MKTVISICIAIIFIACQSKIIIPEKLVGKWNPTYQIQEKTGENSWGPWQTINTFVALPVIEFTSTGRFLNDGKDGAACCYAGNTFRVENDVIFFSDIKSCPQMSCAICSEWKIIQLDSNVLVLETCNTRSRYAKEL